MKRCAINIMLISRTLLIEAIRRKEIYLIVLVAAAMLGGLRFLKFFDMPDLQKFYRELSLKTMNVATALTAIMLAARQLPREFKNRTIYPLLAKPLSRFEFLIGKFVGVMLAAGFCYSIFMAIFLLGNLTLKSQMHYDLFAQGVYLQLLSTAVLVSLTFVLSMLFNTDAAMTLATILFFSSQIMMTMMDYIYDQLESLQQVAIVVLHFAIPQLTLFDPSSKIIHGIWPALSAEVMITLTLYGAGYCVVFLTLAYLLFRRRPI